MRDCAKQFWRVWMVSSKNLDFTIPIKRAEFRRLPALFDNQLFYWQGIIKNLLVYLLDKLGN